MKCLFAAKLALAGMLLGPVQAAVLTVTSAADSGAGTLRETIGAANGGDTIVFDPSLEGMPILLESPIDFGKSLTIDGSTVPGGVILDGQRSTRIMQVFNGKQALIEVEMRKLTFRNGHEDGPLVAGLRVYGVDLRAELCTFEGNISWDTPALKVQKGKAAVTACSFVNNHSRREGTGSRFRAAAAGAITTWLSSVSLINVTISGNSGQIGAVFFKLGGAGPNHCVVRNCTIVDNRSHWDDPHASGGIGMESFLEATRGTVTFHGSIVARNFAVGKGIDNFTAQVELGGEGKLVENPPQPAVSEGFNLTDTDEGYLDHITDRIVDDPGMGPLVREGTCPPWHPVLRESAALDGGDPTASPGEPDGRGGDRVVDGDCDGSARIDIGAIEMSKPIIVDTPEDQDDGSSANGTSLREGCEDIAIPGGGTMRRVVVDEALNGQNCQLGMADGGQGVPIDCAGNVGEVLILEGGGLGLDGGGETSCMKLSGWEAAVVAKCRVSDGADRAVETSDCEASFLQWSWEDCPEVALACGPEAEVGLDGCRFQDCGDETDSEAHAVTVAPGGECTAEATTWDGCATGGNGACVWNEGVCRLANCLVVRSECEGTGAVYGTANATETTSVRCTIADNTCRAADAAGAGICVEAGDCTVRGSIVWGNECVNTEAVSNSDLQREQICESGAGELEVESTCGPVAFAGSHNFAADPEFTDPAASDALAAYTPRRSSRVVDRETSIPVPEEAGELFLQASFFGKIDFTDAAGEQRGGDGNGDGCAGADVGAVERSAAPLAPGILQIDMPSVVDLAVEEKHELSFAVTGRMAFEDVTVTLDGPGALQFLPKDSGLADEAAERADQVRFAHVDPATASGIAGGKYCIRYCPPAGFSGMVRIEVEAVEPEFPGALRVSETLTLEIGESEGVTEVSAVADAAWSEAGTFQPDTLPDNDEAFGDYFRVDLNGRRVGLDVIAAVHQVMSSVSEGSLDVQAGQSLTLDSHVGGGVHGAAVLRDVQLTIGEAASVLGAGRGLALHGGSTTFDGALGGEAVLGAATRGEEIFLGPDLSVSGGRGQLGGGGGLLRIFGTVDADQSGEAITVDGADVFVHELGGILSATAGELRIEDRFDARGGGRIVADGSGGSVVIGAGASVEGGTVAAFNDGEIIVSGGLAGSTVGGQGGVVSLENGASLDGRTEPVAIAGELGIKSGSEIILDGIVQAAAGASPAKLSGPGGPVLALRSPVEMRGLSLETSNLAMRSGRAIVGELLLDAGTSATLRGNSSFENIDLHLGPGGTIHVTDGCFCPEGGSLTLDGTFFLDGGNSATTFLVDGTYRVDGDGLFRSGAGSGNDIRGDEPGDKAVFNVEMELGRCDMGVNQTILEFHDRVGVTGFVLIDPSDAEPSAFRDLLEVQTGGQALLRGGTFDCFGSEFLVRSGGELRFGANGVYFDPTIVSEASGLAHIEGATAFENGVVTGELVIDERAGLTVTKQLTLKDGSLVVAGKNDSTFLHFRDEGDPAGAILKKEGEGAALVKVTGARSSLTVTAADGKLTVGPGVKIDLEDGNLMGNRGELTNRGEIYATRADRNVRFQTPAGVVQHNEGRLGAKGGVMEIIGSEIENIGSGVLEALQNGILKASSSVLRSGIIRSEESGELVIENSTIEGTDAKPARLSGTVTARNSRIGPHVTGDGVTIKTPAEVSSATVVANNIGGRASYVLGRDNHEVRNENPSTGWTLERDQRIGGRGVFTGLTRNEGNIRAENGGKITVRPSSAGSGHVVGVSGRSFARGGGSRLTHEGDLESRGVIGVSGGAVLEASGATTLTGGSETTVDGGRLQSAALRALAGSSVRVAGTVASSLGSTIGGFFALGSSPGAAAVDGALTLEDTAMLEIELAGSGGVPGVDHDYLSCDSDLVLGGTLNPRLTGGFVPGPGESFVVIECDGELSGDFAAIDQPFASLGSFHVDVDKVNDRVRLSFEVTGDATFADYGRLWFTDAEIAEGRAEPGADFEGDGLSLLMEYVLVDGDPGAMNSDDLPALRTGELDLGMGFRDYAIYEMKLRADRPEVTVAVETSAGLTDWASPGALMLMEEVDHGDGWVTRRYRSVDPVGEGGQRFFGRLGVELTSP